MNRSLPPDAHERCSGHMYVVVSHVFPTLRAKMYSRFDTLHDFR